ncbi:virB8 family protein [Paraburkholderia susongensis]|uniref:Type IV secretion system protein VirB8 n=1 Tax=Paraburkholderia susongensis TaxID=1515439 RepID=A0A1X7M7X2_9BURK|nr:type IV secretion system protein [Paraburkholderia susongensis]SMG61562.1 type IV secretion system protein VirB8 [Paraburkholderia susongensis]
MFGLGKKKAAAQGLAAAAAGQETNDIDVGKWYLKQARELERTKQESIESRAKVAKIAMCWMGGIAGVAVIGTTCLALLKVPNPPAVLRVDSSTGKIDVLPTTSKGTVTFGEKEDRAALRRYVELREGYDWETINDMHFAVGVMSDSQEADQYDRFIRGPGSPLTMLKDKARVIAKVGAITFVGKTAQVFFSKEYVPLNPSIARQTTYWVATIAYQRDNLPEKAEVQDINPGGFKVTSYTVARDWSRAPAEFDRPGAPASTAASGVVAGGAQ